MKLKSKAKVKAKVAILTPRKRRLKRRNKEVSSLAYMILKDVEICVRCLGDWAEKGHVLCGPCLAYSNARSRAKREEKKLYILGA